jgi:hypothetical protein
MQPVAPSQLPFARSWNSGLLDGEDVDGVSFSDSQHVLKACQILNSVTDIPSGSDKLPLILEWPDIAFG